MRSLRDEAQRADSLLHDSIDHSFNNPGQTEDSFGLYLARKVDFTELQAATRQFFYLNIPLHYRTTLKDLAAKDFEWRLHPMHGALFTSNQSPASLAAFDEKPAEGFIDSAFFKKKRTLEVRDSFINSSLILDERPVVPFRTFVPKILCDNNLVAFAAKGNQTHHQEVAVDFSLLFNKGMRITILAEGEGPFAPQVPAAHQMSNYCVTRLACIFREKLQSGEARSAHLDQVMKASMEELHTELISNDPTRPFDAILSGAAGTFGC